MVISVECVSPPVLPWAAPSFDSSRTGVVLVLNRERRVRSNSDPAQPTTVVCGILDLRPLQSTDTSDRNNKKMAGETVVETPQDNTKVDEPIKTDKEVIAEEEAAQANEVRMI